MFIISFFIIQSIFWDVSRYISDGSIIMTYTTTSTLWSIQASIMVFMSSRVVLLCNCCKTAWEAQPNSISKMSRSFSPWCHKKIEFGPAHNYQCGSVLCVVSQLLFSRCDSSSPRPLFLFNAPLLLARKAQEKQWLTLAFFARPVLYLLSHFNFDPNIF